MSHAELLETIVSMSKAAKKRTHSRESQSGTSVRSQPSTSTAAASGIGPPDRGRSAYKLDRRPQAPGSGEARARVAPGQHQEGASPVFRTPEEPVHDRRYSVATTSGSGSWSCASSVAGYHQSNKRQKEPEQTKVESEKRKPVAKKPESSAQRLAKKEAAKAARLTRNTRQDERRAIRVMPCLKIRQLENIKSTFTTEGVDSRCQKLKDSFKDSDVAELCDSSLLYGWMGVNHHKDGKYITFASPNGATVAAFQLRHDFKFPPKLRQALSDRHIIKVCHNADKTIDVLRTYGATAVKKLLEAQVLLTQYKLDWDQILEMPGGPLDEEKDRPFEDPAMFKGKILAAAYRMVQQLACVVWEIASLVMPNSEKAREHGNLCQWTREVFALYATYRSRVEGDPIENPPEAVAKTLRYDLYTVEEEEWVCGEMPSEHVLELRDYLDAVSANIDPAEFRKTDFFVNRCRRCGMGWDHPGMSDCYIKDEVCAYPLCQEKTHSIITCNKLKGLCNLCFRRGHTAEDHAHLKPLHLENMFLIYSRFHLTAGCLSRLKPTHGRYCFLSLYQDYNLSPKLRYAYGITKIIQDPDDDRVSPLTNYSNTELLLKTRNMPTSELELRLANCDTDLLEAEKAVKEIKARKAFLAKELSGRDRAVIGTVGSPVSDIEPTVVTSAAFSPRTTQAELLARMHITDPPSTSRKPARGDLKIKKRYDSRTTESDSVSGEDRDPK